MGGHGSSEGRDLGGVAVGTGLVRHFDQLSFGGRVGVRAGDILIAVVGGIGTLFFVSNSILGFIPEIIAAELVGRAVSLEGDRDELAEVAIADEVLGSSQSKGDGRQEENPRQHDDGRSYLEIEELNTNS